MLQIGVEFVGGALLFLFGVIIAGLGVVLLWALVAQVIQSSVEFYREHFGVEGAYPRTREMLDAEGREYFDEAMGRLHIEGVSPERPDEVTLQKWREEDEELPGDARRRERQAGE